MGRRIPKSLDDFVRWGYHLLAECPKCGRKAIYDTRQIVSFFRSRGHNTALGAAEHWFVCTGRPPHEPGCGHRGAELTMIAPHMRLKPQRPEPIR